MSGKHNRSLGCAEVAFWCLTSSVVLCCAVLWFARSRRWFYLFLKLAYGILTKGSHEAGRENYEGDSDDEEVSVANDCVCVLAHGESPSHWHLLHHRTRVELEVPLTHCPCGGASCCCQCCCTPSIMSISGSMPLNS